MSEQTRDSGTTDLNEAYASAKGAWDAEHVVSDAEGTWSGPAGDDYHKDQIRPDRSGFWEGFLDEYRPASVLECGCGTGFNLEHIPRGVGIDVNIAATQKTLGAIQGSVLDIPFRSRTFELVFTCGVLIHLEEPEVVTAMEEMNRVSSQFVMLMEYYHDTWERMPYREGLSLHKGPFNVMYEDIMGVDPIDQGFLRRKEGFDNVTWWLFPRR